MGKVNVFHDSASNTLTIWFGNPEDEVEAEETGNDVLLMKDKDGNVIGVEKLNFLTKGDKSVHVVFESRADQDIQTLTNRRASLGRDREAFTVPDDFDTSLPENILASFEGEN